MNSEPAAVLTASRESARYQTLVKLGQGGMAHVYLIMSTGPGGVKKLLVRKELLPDLKEDPDFVAMFLDEARIALRLNHPNVIQTYEVSSEGEHPSIIMEYLEGYTLGSVIHRVGRTKLPLPLHLHVLTEVLAGLHHAHEVCDFDGTPFSVVHRDVSPQNVFLTYDGQVKLVDFGIAKATCTDRTRTGVWKGKANYAAPEQMFCTEIDRRTDIFSVGAMLWEALAERRLAADLPEVAMMQRRVTGQDPKILTVAPDTPVDLARICDRAMAHEQSDRYGSAEEMRADLSAYLETTRRRGSRELAELVSSAFAAERAKMRSRIDLRVKELLRPPSSGAAPSVEPSVPAPAAEIPSMGTPGRVALTNDRRSSAESESPPRVASRRSRQLLALGVGVVALGVAVSLGRARLGPAPREAGPLPAPSAGGSPADAPSVAPTPAVELVDVTISARPASARIYLDDVAQASNPYHAEVKRSTQPHRVRLEAAGFVTDERIISLGADLRLEVDLRPAPLAPPPDPGPRAAPRFSGGTARPAPREATSRSPVTPEPPAPASALAPAPAPGDPIAPATQRRSRSIDEKF